MKEKCALNPDSVAGDPTDFEGVCKTSAVHTDHHTFKRLGAHIIALDDLDHYSNRVTRSHIRDIFLELFFFNRAYQIHPLILTKKAGINRTRSRQLLTTRFAICPAIISRR